jgi:hypothetical protein
VSCEDNYLALVYPVGAQQHYRVVLLDSGEIEEGVLEE